MVHGNRSEPVSAYSNPIFKINLLDCLIVMLLFSFLYRRKKKKVTKNETPLFSLRGGQASLEWFI
jgi:hypothetical protein